MESWRNELYHHGILGQRWGVRRYQNSDGTLTAAGKKRYSSFLPDREPSRPSWQGTTNAFERMKRQRGINPRVSRPGSLRPKNKSEKKQLTDEEKAKRKETAKKIAKGVAIGAGVAAAGYGAYKLGKHVKLANEIEPDTKTIDMTINDIVALARGKSTPSLDQKINKMAEEIKNDTTSNITKGTLASIRNETKKNIAKSLGTDESLKKAVDSLDDDTMALLKKYNFQMPSGTSAPSPKGTPRPNDKLKKALEISGQINDPTVAETLKVLDLGADMAKKRQETMKRLLDMNNNASKSVGSLSKSIDKLDDYTQYLLKKQRESTR